MLPDPVPNKRNECNNITTGPDGRHKVLMTYGKPHLCDCCIHNCGNSGDTIYREFTVVAVGDHRRVRTEKVADCVSVRF